jgi:hypothetical protein
MVTDKASLISMNDIQSPTNESENQSTIDCDTLKTENISRHTLRL